MARFPKYLVQNMLAKDQVDKKPKGIIYLNRIKNNNNLFE